MPGPFRMTTFAAMFNGARILVAPLDWGLGHAARCVPIIQRLIDHDAIPILGADHGALALLRMEFPQLEHVRIPGVIVRYSPGNNQLWSLARQFPAMVRSVRVERALFDRLRHQLRLSAVISDQRFGIRSPDLPSVLITHQVFPFTPVAQGALRRSNMRHIARFDRCWIMDEAEAPGLAGELSHGHPLPPNACYIGTVSRMSLKPAISLGKGGPQLGKELRVVAVISGPEPQRTLLEHRLIEQLRELPGEQVLFLGQPDSPRNERIGNVLVRAHTSGAELSEILLAADLIISRSGYTTLMDLAALDRYALLIPTPGQLEQEYLGKLHARTGRFIVQQQEGLDVKAALAKASALSPRTSSTDKRLLEQALVDLAALLR